ncbi:MAG: hypothetical protein FWB98_04285 [Defluviitaleaceae bacterium]|nr:hypothetical protein [Defluviitaleaceae bacterium]
MTTSPPPYSITSFGFCVGADFYLALPDKEETKKFERRDISLIQIGLYLLVNALLIMINSSNLLQAVTALAFVFFGCAAVGWIGTLVTKRKWSFRLTQGGFLVSPVSSILFFFPMIGNWYPVHYENTPQLKRDLALNSILVWLFLLGVAASGSFLDNGFLSSARGVASVLLIYRCLPFMPMSSHGSGRVFKWNKAVFFALAVASVLLVFVF